MTTKQQSQPARKTGFFNIILIIGLVALLYGEAYFGYYLQAFSSQQEQIKEDYSTIKSVTFGVFSIDKWRVQMDAVLNHEISDFKLSHAQKKAMQAKVEEKLHGLVHETFAEINKPQKTLIGKLEKFAVKEFVDTSQIQALMPEFSKTIVDKVTSPASTKRLKNIVLSKLNELEKETYDSTEIVTKAVTSYMYNKYHVHNASEFDQEINSELTAIRILTFNYLFAMLGCVAGALCLWWLMRNQTHLQRTLFFISLLFALVLLIVGVTSSIIEVDAELKEFNFMVMGETISFGNQVLYFQSKSILQIVEVLIRQPKPDTVVVGTLILLFVIILPIVRIIAKGVHVMSTKRLARNKVVNYLAFHAAKWDMSDVMVVGILMTYIGLNGILKSQLSILDMHNSLIDTSTVNNTSLQPGYFVFVGYAVLAIVLGSILNRITSDKPDQEE